MSKKKYTVNIFRLVFNSNLSIGFYIQLFVFLLQKMEAKGMVLGTNEDIWDDRLLIKAYEQAIQLQSSDVAKSIADNTNKKSKSLPTQPCDMSIEEGEEEEKVETTFKLADYVRATYNEDNIDYEAQIISIDENSDTCVVKFIGYDNEQTVRLVDLVDSWGEGEQQKQISEAAAVEAEADESNADSEENVYPREIYRNHGLFQNSLPTPPIPPMPPMIKDSLGEEAEHFSAMLMSWYMSGYYTGLYQGHKLAKQQSKRLKRK